MQIDLVISRNINGTAVIQSGVKNGNRVVFRHIDLIKDSEASIFRTLVNTSLAELYLVVCERIRSDEICTVCIYMERNIVGGTVKYPGKIFSQDIFSRCLGSCEEKILPHQDSGNRHFQDFFSIKRNGRLHDSV